MRKTRPGTIQNTLQAAYRAAGGIEDAAEDAGASIAEMSYGTMMEPRNRGGLGINFVDALCRANSDASVALATHFSALAGGTFQPIPVASGEVGNRCAQAAQKCGDAIAAMIESTMNDGSEEHVDRARQQVIEAVSELMGYVSELPQAPRATRLREVG